MQIRPQGGADWLESLPNHPIFTPPEQSTSSASQRFSLDELRAFTNASSNAKERSLGGTKHRMDKMCFRGPDLILAVGKELRIATLVDSKNDGSGKMGQHKTIHTPNIEFDIHQLALCPGGKMLAIAGECQVAVIVLPRPSYYKLVNTRVDCKATQVGQYYHAVSGSSPIVKIAWHPWNDGGSSLLVMTLDGNLREYDISRDTEEPQQTVSFVPSAKRGAFTAEDPATREVVSFCIGKGQADWSALTVYALMRSGDIWAMSPFLPSNAMIPPSYIPSLECFVAAKRELINARTSAFMKADPEDDDDDDIVITNDLQLKYVNALMKQLPPNFSQSSKPHNIRPPNASKYPVARQGPFLLQPAPRELEGGEEFEATDIAYLSFGDDEDGMEPESESERLGVVAVVYQNGKVDLCLDVEKIEARWDLKKPFEDDLPIFAVYETIDLGLISALKSGDNADIDSLETNHPIFHVDPLYGGRLYVSHLFGIHALDMRTWMRALSNALGNEEPEPLVETINAAQGTEVTHLLNTYAPEYNTNTPIIATTIIDNGFIDYTLFAVTRNHQMVPIELRLRPTTHREETSFSAPSKTRSKSSSQPSTTTTAPPAYVSLLAAEPFSVPTFTPHRTSALLVRPEPPRNPDGNVAVTAETLRSLGKSVNAFRMDIRDMTRGVNVVQSRIELQSRELGRQLQKLAVMAKLLEDAKRENALRSRLKDVTITQTALLARLDKVVQTLMDSYSPKLSEYETKWFAELKRMQREVGTSTDGRSLQSRTELLANQIEILRPQLVAISKKAEERKQAPHKVMPHTALGSAQLRGVQRRLAQEGQILGAAREQAEKLTKWLEQHENVLH